MVGALGGLCLKKEALWRSHSRSSTFISNPNDSGSRMATMAFDTVAGEMEVEEWKVAVANPDRTEGSIVLMLFTLM